MQTHQKLGRARAYLTSGEKFQKAGKFDQAMEQYQQALQLNPNFVQALVRLSIIYESRKELDLAIDCIQKAIQLRPGNDKFLVKLMDIYSKFFSKKNDIDEVIAIYLKVLQENQSRHLEIAHEKLGQILLKISIRQGNFDRAIAFFQELIKTQSNEPWLHYNLGLSLYKYNQLDEAESCYRRAIQLNPKFWQALIELGRVLDKKGDKDQAFQYGINAIQLNPQLRIQHYQYLHRKRHSVEEWNVLKKTLQTNIEQGANVAPWQYMQLGKKLSQHGEFSEAIPYYQQSLYNQLKESKPEYISRYWDSGKLQEPNFQIIGVAKCGTTALYDYLSQHPQFLPSVVKEPQYLSSLLPQINKIEKQDDWSLLNAERDFYLAHFPPRPESSPFITGESSVNSIYPGVEKVVYNWFPKIKLIILFRDPVKRVISHYNHMLKKNRPKHSFEQEISLQLEQFEGITESALKDIIIRNNQDTWLIAHSLYIYILERWIKLFQKEQFLVLSNEDLAQDPAGVMKQVFDFLEMPENNTIRYIPKNVGHYPSDINPNLLSRLQKFFRSHNQRLEDFLGRKFDWES